MSGICAEVCGGGIVQVRNHVVEIKVTYVVEV